MMNDGIEGKCNICNRDMTVGPLHTAPCSHTTHYSCYRYMLQNDGPDCTTCSDKARQAPLPSATGLTSNIVDPKSNDNEPLSSSTQTQQPRGKSYHMDGMEGICNICKVDMTVGPLYTAPCSHTTHYDCYRYMLQNDGPDCTTCSDEARQASRLQLT